MSYADRLKNMDSDYQRAQVDSRGLPPDDNYQAVVDRFDFLEWPTGLFLKTEMRIHGGDYDGMHVETIHAMEDPDRMEFLKKHLQALGAMPERLSDIEKVLPSALDAVVDVTVKTSDRTNAEGQPYRNLYVNKVIRSMVSDIGPSAYDPVDDPEPSAEQAKASEVDIPF